MRLIEARTLSLVGDDSGFMGPSYAILSHRWIHGQEVLLQDFLNRNKDDNTNSEGWLKIKSCCAQALADGLEYVWIDTCCIDKESSAELSEAINSMFQWYRGADVCYAYLHDVKLNDETSWRRQFRSSVWFERAWTLQELIAPSRLEFFDREWESLGNRSSLVSEISKASGIHERVFHNESYDLSEWSVAQRMSWASRRKATRIEDIAYSLLGIFDVNMPLLYGEGQKAFLRLQEEIIKRTYDHSIFAWSGSPQFDFGNRLTQVLAASPLAFRHDGDVQCTEFDPPVAYSLSNLGLQIKLRMKPWGPRLCLAALNCSGGPHNRQIGIFIIKKTSGQTVAFRAIIGGRSCTTWTRERGGYKRELITIATRVRMVDITRLEQTINRPRMRILVDVNSLVEPKRRGSISTVTRRLTENATSYPWTDALTCLMTASSRSSLMPGGDLRIISLPLSEAPQYGITCIFMLPLGTEHINAIKLGIDTNCNPVCVLADNTNVETSRVTPKIDHCGASTDNAPATSSLKTFWQWNCLESENWFHYDKPASGKALPLRARPPYLRSGLWTMKGKRDKASSFRLPLGVDDERDSVVVKFGIERLSEDELYWKFSIDWSYPPQV